MLRHLLPLLLLLLPQVAAAEPEVRPLGAEALRIERLRAMSGVQPGRKSFPFRESTCPYPRHACPEAYEYAPTRDPLPDEATRREREDWRWGERERWGEPEGWEAYALERYRFWSDADLARERARSPYEVDPSPYAVDPVRDLDANHRYRYRHAYERAAPDGGRFRGSRPNRAFDPYPHLRR